MSKHVPTQSEKDWKGLMRGKSAFCSALLTPINDAISRGDLCKEYKYSIEEQKLFALIDTKRTKFLTTFFTDMMTSTTTGSEIVIIKNISTVSCTAKSLNAAFRASIDEKIEPTTVILRGYQNSTTAETVKSLITLRAEIEELLVITEEFLLENTEELVVQQKSIALTPASAQSPAQSPTQLPAHLAIKSQEETAAEKKERKLFNYKKYYCAIRHCCFRTDGTVIEGMECRGTLEIPCWFKRTQFSNPHVPHCDDHYNGFLQGNQ